MMIKTKYLEMSVPPKSYLASVLKNYQTYEEAETQLLLSLLSENDWFVDVGAHVGWFSTILASQGVWVTAIEPNPHVLPYLAENLSPYFSHSAILPFAAFNTNGHAMFHLPSEYDDGWGSLAGADDHSLGQTTMVQIRRLEEALWIDREIKVLKLDVEGVELQVLYGLGHRLDHVEHILVELADRPDRVKKSGSTVEGIKKLLSGWSATPVSEQNFLFTNPVALGAHSFRTQEVSA